MISSIQLRWRQRRFICGFQCNSLLIDCVILPRVLPERIKVIVSTNSKSEACSYFKKIKCEFFKLNCEEEILEMMIKKFLDNKELLVNKSHQDKMVKLMDDNFDKWSQNYTKIKSIYSTCIPFRSEMVSGLKQETID